MSPENIGYIPPEEQLIARNQELQGKEDLWTPEKGYWISPDIALADFVYLEPGEKREVKIQLTQNSLPPLNKISLENLRLLRTSPRSRLGQVFIEFEEFGERIYSFIRDNGITDLNGISPEELQPEIVIANDGLRPNIVSNKGGAFRAFLLGGKQLIGDEIQQSRVLIDGQPIQDHILKKNHQGTPIAIRLSLNPETRKFIPRSQRPIQLDLMHSDQRGQINPLLRPVPEGDRIIPYLVKSSERLTMPNGMYGMVREFAYAKYNGTESHRSLSVHGTSQFLDPDRDWPIIFELKGRTSKEEVANFIDIFLYEAEPFEF